MAQGLNFSSFLILGLTELISIPGSNSDVYLYPVALFDDPFRKAPNKIALCETYTFDQKPCGTNLRAACKEVMSNEKVAVSEINSWELW